MAQKYQHIIFSADYKLGIYALLLGKSFERWI